MPVIITKIGEGNQTPLTHARILVDSYVSNQDTEITTFPSGDDAGVDALRYPTTYEGWEPETWSTGDYKTIVFTHSAGAGFLPLDCVVIAAHNLGGIGVNVRAYYKEAGEDTVVSASYYPTDNSPIMFLFDQPLPADAEYFGIEFQKIGDDWPETLPRINVIQAGVCLVMPRPIFLDHAPNDINTDVVISNAKSIGGQALGFSVRRQGSAASYTWSHVPNAFIYDDFKEFKDYAEIGRGFFTIAWRPGFQPKTDNISPGVQYGCVAGTISHKITGQPDYFDISMTVSSAGAVR